MATITDEQMRQAEDAVLRVLTNGEPVTHEILDALIALGWAPQEPDHTLGLPSSRDQDDASEERSEVGELHGPLKALLEDSNRFPTPSGTIGMGLTRDRAVEILNACSPLVSVGVNFEHHDGDMTSMVLRAYITLSRSELGMAPRA